MVLHIDMDAFFASIEQAINPRFRDKPLIVGSRGNKMRTVVCAASYAAKVLGIHSGMPSREAFAICPNLEFVAADQSKYIWTSEQIFGLLKAYNLPLNYASIDEFQIDLAGHPNPVNLGKEVKEKIYANFNITASVGIAKNWLLAKLASKINKPNSLTLINDKNFEEVLRQTSLDKFSGMGGKGGRFFMAEGLKTCWDLYLNLLDFFNDSYGNCGKFEENSDNPNEKPKSISHSYTLPSEEVQINPPVIQAWIGLLMVATGLRQQNLVSATVHLWLNGPEIGNFVAQKTRSVAVNDGYEIYQRAIKIMVNSGLKNPRIRAIGVTCSSLSRGIYQPLLSERGQFTVLTRTASQIKIFN